MTRRSLAALVRDVAPLQAFQWTLACLAWFLTSTAIGKVDVTETFDIGTGTRFDAFRGNVQPPVAIALTSPADGSMQNMGFGDEVLDYSAVKTNQFGLTTTNFVGQANGASGAGEFGGMFNWLRYGHVADTNIGPLTLGSATVEDPIRIKFTALLLDFPDAQNASNSNDETITIGYFQENLGLSTPVNTVGDDDDMRRAAGPALTPANTVTGAIGFNGSGRFRLSLFGVESPTVWDFRFHPNPVGPDTGPIDVDLTLVCLECDDGMGTAKISGTVNGHEVSYERPNITGTDTRLMGEFGIGQAFRNPGQIAWRRRVAFIDDLTYTVETDGGIDNPNPTRLGPPIAVGNGGDYNGDGVVNAADFVVWRENFGAMGTPGSVLGDGTSDDLLGTPDGDVDQFDYDFWRARFGNAVPSAASTLSVVSIPEPSSLVLILISALPSFCRRRLRSR